jgi:uridylate kinase
LQFKKIILKLSGEALSGNKNIGIEYDVILELSKSIKFCLEAGVQIGIVIGGGNFWRGKNLNTKFMNSRVNSDKIGMLATVMNSLVLSDVLASLGIKNKIQSSVFMPQICEIYSVDLALTYFEENYVIIFSAGIGAPFFSTDTAAVLRASELSDFENRVPVFKATNIDGVYDRDPNKDVNAKKYDKLNFDEILNKNLKVIDSAAASLCRDNKIPVLVFDIKKPENLILAIQNKKIGTWISA